MKNKAVTKKLSFYCRNLFLSKLEDKKIKKIRSNRIRQVRKFSSSFLFNNKKNSLYNYSSFVLKGMLKPSKFELSKIFAPSRLMERKEVDNRLNRKLAGKIFLTLEKLKKKTRMKKTSKKFRQLSFFVKNPQELFRQNPLNKFYNSNLQIISFSYDLLLSFHSAIGNSSKSWINPSVFSKVLAIRNDMILYDMSSFFLCFRKGLQSVFQVSKFKGSIIGYINSEKHYKFSGIGFEHFLRIWLPGYLTNFKQVIKNILSLQSKNVFNLTRRQSKFLDNIYLKRDMPLNYYYYLMKKKFRGKKKVTKIPSVPSFGFSLEDYDIWVNECQKSGLRTMAICDSESFPRKIDYPIIANQKSLPLNFFFVKLISEAVGSAKRFEYFSFSGFNFLRESLNNTKVDEGLLKKTSIAVTGKIK